MNLMESLSKLLLRSIGSSADLKTRVDSAKRLLLQPLGTGSSGEVERDRIEELRDAQAPSARRVISNLETEAASLDEQLEKFRARPQQRRKHQAVQRGARGAEHREGHAEQARRLAPSRRWTAIGGARRVQLAEVTQSTGGVRAKVRRRRRRRSSRSAKTKMGERLAELESRARSSGRGGHPRGSELADLRGDGRRVRRRRDGRWSRRSIAAGIASTRAASATCTCRSSRSRRSWARPTSWCGAPACGRILLLKDEVRCALAPK